MIYIALLAILVIGIVVIIMRNNAANKKIRNSPKLKELTDYLFRENQRPNKIVITFGNEIFYGPIDNNFVQVPRELIPNMDQTERGVLADIIHKDFSYSFLRCNDRHNHALSTSSGADTGNNYIDSHASFVLTAKGNGNAGW